MKALAVALALATADGCALFSSPAPAPLPTASVAAPPPVSDGASCPSDCAIAHEHCPTSAVTIGQCEAVCVAGAHNITNSSRCVALTFTCDEACP